MKKYLIILIITIPLIVTKSYSQNRLNDSSLIAYWSFDSIIANIIYDQSFYGNHGTNYGSDIVDGKRGLALSFNGVSDYARIPADGEAPNPIFSTLGVGSISLWFKVNYIPLDFGIMPMFFYGAEDSCFNMFDASNEGLIIEVGHSPVHSASERLYFTIWSSGCGFPTFCYDSWRPIETGKWYHYVAVVGENYNTGFLNGEEMTYRHYNFGNITYSEFFEDAEKHEKLWLGKGYWDAQPMFFDGMIDEVRVYNRPLDLEDVMELYKDTLLGVGIHNFKGSTLDFNIFPNPVSKTSTIEYLLKESAKVEITILNQGGQQIEQLVNERQTKGDHQIIWDTRSITPGLYVCRLKTNGLVETIKIVVLE